MPQDRNIVLDRLRQDLIGPDKPDEVIEDRPSDRYLTGILWPPATRMGGEDIDRLGAGGDEETDGGEEDEVPMVGAMRPSVAGLSFAVGGETFWVDVEVAAAYYDPEEQKGRKVYWRRRAFQSRLSDIDCTKALPVRIPIPDAADGVVLHVRSAPWSGTGARLVTVTLINAANPSDSGRQAVEAATLFQVKLTIFPSERSCLLPRPDRRAVIDDDDLSSALLYRNTYQFAVGHTCSATWADPSEATVAWIATEWIPAVEVLGVSADGDAVFTELKKGALRTLDADWLADADDVTLGRALLRLPAAYRKWLSGIAAQARDLAGDNLRRTAERHLVDCEDVASRLESGAKRISSDPRLATAFRLSNRAMVLQRQWSDGTKLEWRPFQLGFLLLTAISAIDGDDEHRRTMDLLWFPTGGGKTEAYLGLIAFVALARRLRGGDSAAGVAALMRYTLRLLTTQQFTRAAAMMLACEAIRRGRVPVRDDRMRLGYTPFGIGLWVGGEATPNDAATAADALASGEDQGPTPRQILDCPACGQHLRWAPRRANGKAVAIEVRCVNAACILHDGEAPLPVYTVDEDVYAARPTLLLGTVDKFAQIVRHPAAGRLFDAGGAAPPDLVIQDELHLISGPLGTMVGLYEAGIDRLFWRDGSPPKVIGSTATIRRAADQVKALFNRKVCQFPPPALDSSDSAFAVADNAHRGRLFAGVTTAGRSAKFALQAVSGSLLESGAAAFNDDAKRDPYWTLVTYFNSLRELGGALVLMQDDVPDAIRLYARRRGEQKSERKALYVQELTSRRTQKEVRNMLHDMAIAADRDGAIDVVLASNMMSVGVDIPRLSLMLVNGQPKGIAEYIQATSRVGRRHPGLVVCLLNNGKARDRSHFETFRTWHATLYRDVEATSVTPFAPRARDRALHATLIAAARHLVPGLALDPRLDADQIAGVENLIRDIVGRAQEIDESETAVRIELERFLRLWRTRGAAVWWEDRSPGRSLLVSAEAAAALRAQGLDARGAVPTPNSMRNVEAAVPFRLATGLAGKRGTT
jgi:hypothetical protein